MRNSIPFYPGTTHLLSGGYNVHASSSSVPRAPAGLRKYENCYRKVPWDVGQVNDIWFALHYFEGLVCQLQKLRAMTMCHPFTLHIGGMPQKLQPFLKELVQDCWLDFAYYIFIYRLAFGIIPYYYVHIKV